MEPFEIKFNEMFLLPPVEVTIVICDYTTRPFFSVKGKGQHSTHCHQQLNCSLPTLVSNHPKQIERNASYYT